MAGTELFREHHVITQDLAPKSLLLSLLAKNKLFNLNAPQNLLNLPTDRKLAQSLDISPHPGGPLGTYGKRLTEALGKIERSRDFAAASAGAAARIAVLMDKEGH
ncbi:hypothetical protein EN742_11090 [Mesorhizobium sp. M4A.F.Ca.ET.020.02.1.1]|uniref:AHH domain-containing protein n=1 Tax=unclassified Mesorhizobium TaxID=325217 RepID=UPI000FCBE147|nr:MULTISPECIES: AHH domain-containing protein [unclassified Mesorhizobium]RUX45282.1 hypothetical protein EOA33_24470 [Mesorhizobium sp. M4A.F.Ca.ET.050.02.1.1]RVC75119.1 hypothetical protein EN745_28305 [Mesorhizobium sp. M4A.F.Ca.ET.022.05.2.1]RVD41071.1 hypothetical protein EN742_11090 [Mesorhizobium sp. M4A.F.Ca.ET.020.02.1.1]RWC11260.1 MAG: hypothetical protein EOS53_27685 [Mesorhizobium sp.]RWD33432.1 MAG: hypothetical protein EOS22_01420 [Mesorhizobium sp.]